MRRLVCLSLTLAALAVPAGASAQANKGCIGLPGCAYTSVSAFPLPVDGIGLAADSAGNLYVTNQGAGQVYRFSSTGDLNGNWQSSAGSGLFGIAVTPDGSQIYAVDNQNSTIAVFNGTTPNTSETQKLAAGALNRPQGIALSGSTLNVADTLNRRLLQLSTSGAEIDQVTTSFPPNWVAVDPLKGIWTVSIPVAANANAISPAIQEFSPTLVQGTQAILPLIANPNGVAIDSVGDLYISDGTGNLILQYNPAGVLIGYFGGNGNQVGELETPLGIAVDGADNLSVIDSGNKRIQTFALASVAQAQPVGSGATFKGAKAPIEVHCLARGIPTCEGTLTLRTQGKTVGQQTYSTADDTSDTVKVPLKKRAKRALERRGKLRVKAFARTRSAPGTDDRVTVDVQRLKRPPSVCCGPPQNDR